MLRFKTGLALCKVRSPVQSPRSIDFYLIVFGWSHTSTHMSAQNLKWWRFRTWFRLWEINNFLSKCKFLFIFSSQYCLFWAEDQQRVLLFPMSCRDIWFFSSSHCLKPTLRLRVDDPEMNCLLHRWDYPYVHRL